MAAAGGDPVGAYLQEDSVAGDPDPVQSMAGQPAVQPDGAHHTALPLLQLLARRRQRPARPLHHCELHLKQSRQPTSPVAIVAISKQTEWTDNGVPW